MYAWSNSARRTARCAIYFMIILSWDGECSDLLLASLGHWTWGQHMRGPATALQRVRSVHKRVHVHVYAVCVRIYMYVSWEFHLYMHVCTRIHVYTIGKSMQCMSVTHEFNACQVNMHASCTTRSHRCWCHHVCVCVCAFYTNTDWFIQHVSCMLIEEPELKDLDEEDHDDYFL